MALSRRSGQRFQAAIWPGFVDAMTALLLVLMFVLTIFMVVQFVLRETITGQETELDELTSQIVGLADALGLERSNRARLEDDLTQLSATLTTARAEGEAQAALIAQLRGQAAEQAAALAEGAAQISAFETQVAALIAQRDGALEVNAQQTATIADLEGAQAELISSQEALQLALAQIRDEVDLQTEEARLAAARREALEALVVDLTTEAEESSARILELDSENAALTVQLTEEEAARIEAARAAEALRADLSAEEAARLALDAQTAQLQVQLTAEEQARLVEAAAAEALRARLQDADAELTAMTLALEEQRAEAEETLTLLAAANATRDSLDLDLAEAMIALEALRITEEDLTAARAELAQLEEVERALVLERARLQEGQADTDAQLAEALAARLAAETRETGLLSNREQQAVLLSTANQALSEAEAQNAESQREVALLNEQVAALRGQIGALQNILDEAAARDAGNNVQIDALGNQLNAALAQVASEERRRRELEEAERIRAEAEAARLADEALNLEQFRSEFFGRLREVLGNQEGVRIEGDRFVFASEVLFPPGGFDLSVAGRGEITKVAEILRNVAGEIPPEINWVIRVDGHTDNVPLSGTGRYRNNWELSQGRALSVVQYMIDELNFPPDRLAATGFGEHQPISLEDSEAGRAQNRRIELKLTEQ
ncbi:peptidoglycan -binding protein [Cochlodiniinecator piscidefendens]|uniref:peptidoglycan -binding protein n=1 Tax=Cochlodiniinecator piscidefendens TaxID=2715756 RepID=UPI00140D6781|nr:peptidoglycan -binding protein [Cochlodiniinecator piscidefendens]